VQKVLRYLFELKERVAAHVLVRKNTAPGNVRVLLLEKAMLGRASKLFGQGELVDKNNSNKSVFS